MISEKAVELATKAMCRAMSGDDWGMRGVARAALEAALPALSLHDGGVTQTEATKPALPIRLRDLALWRIAKGHVEVPNLRAADLVEWEGANELEQLCEILGAALCEHDQRHGRFAVDYLPKHWTHQARKALAGRTPALIAEDGGAKS